MKFHVLTAQKRGPRLGILKHIENKPQVEIPTPAVFLHTQGGHVPHVTHEVFKLVSKEPQVLQIPLVSVHNMKDTMQHYNGTISEFIGSKDSVICLTIHDPSYLTKQGHHTKGMIPIWTKRGKFLYNAGDYMKVVESFNPDMYCLLSDSDTNISSPQKRILKSVEMTLELNKACLNWHRNSALLKNKFVIAPVAGGYCLKSRKRCLQSVLENSADVQGILIDGLHNNGPEVEFLPHKEVESVVDFIINNTPADKMVSVQGCWNPINIIKFVQQGVDVFDTSYCRVLTERSAAMTFSFENNASDSEEFEINLRVNKYAEDFTPIMMSCDCLACRMYSRGYIHHLLTVQELLGPVLIMIHNMHHFLKFFQQIRLSIANGTLGALEEKISGKFAQFMRNSETNDVQNENVRRDDQRNDV